MTLGGRIDCSLWSYIWIDGALFYSVAGMAEWCVIRWHVFELGYNF
jgi:hypothetical protein